MPTILDPLPANVKAEIDALRAALDLSIPPKKPERNLLIGTWNLRAFGSLTRKWTAASTDTPKRDLRAAVAIAEILSRFDVIAIQEAVGDLRALRDILKYLGDKWGFLMTDENLGDAGNNERMVFLFDTTRVKPSGLACELVLPTEWLTEVSPDAMTSQFARTPYAASFVAGNNTFILVTLHVLYGSNPAGRIPELKGLARWMSAWAKRSSDWEQNLLALGDFNIDRKDDLLWQAFTSTGLSVPADLETVPRTIFSNPSKPSLDKFYDQIAWFSSTTTGLPRLSLEYIRGGGFDFMPYIYKDTTLTKSSISFRMSDHYPLWAEFALA